MKILFGRTGLGTLWPKIVFKRAVNGDPFCLYDRSLAIGVFRFFVAVAWSR